MFDEKVTEINILVILSPEGSLKFICKTHKKARLAKKAMSLSFSRTTIK
jgi:hypothetical protein